MLCVHDSNFILEVQDINFMIADIYALEVLKNLPRCYPCVKGNCIAHLGIPRFFKCVDDEALCFPLRRLKCVPVRDAGAMYGFGFDADNTGRAVGNQFVVYCQEARAGKRCTKSFVVVKLVHYEDD